MIAVTIDTLKFANRLKQAGMPSEQAEAQAQAIVEALDASSQSLTTQQGLRSLEAKMDKGFAAVDTRFAEIKGEMVLLKWMLGVTVAGVIALVMKLFIHV